jgi:hypothetical protein
MHHMLLGSQCWLFDAQKKMSLGTLGNNVPALPEITGQYVPYRLLGNPWFVVHGSILSRTNHGWVNRLM